MVSVQQVEHGLNSLLEIQGELIGRQGLRLFAFWKNDRFSKSDAHRLTTVRGGVICSQEILFEFIECFGLAFPCWIFCEVVSQIFVLDLGFFDIALNGKQT